MKKIACAILAALTVVLMLAGCSGEPEVPEVFRKVEAPAPTSFNSYVNWTFEEVVAHTPYVFRAEFDSYEGDESTGRYEMKFTVLEKLRGELDFDTVFVRVECENWCDGVYEEYNYVKGHEYLLLVERYSSVYLDHDIFFSLGDTFLPVTDDLGVYMYYSPAEVDLADAQDESLSNTQRMVSYVEELASQPSEFAVDSNLPFTTSTDIDEIVRETEFVLLVTPKSSIMKAEWRGTETFRCSVECVYKGEYDVPDEILLPFFFDQINIDESYVVLVNRVHGASSVSDVFGMSCKDGVTPASDSAAVQRIMDALDVE